MGTIKLKCSQCGHIIEKNAHYFGLESEQTLMCKKCKTMCQHKLVDIQFDEDDPQFQENNGWKWDVKSRLKYIDDKTLDIATKLAQYKDLITYSPIGYKCIKINVYYKDCCHQDVFQQLISDLENNREITLSKEHEIFTAIMDQDFTLCPDPTCTMNRCLFKIAGYIQYLIDRHELEDALKERLAFQNQKTIPVTYYNFEWNPSFQFSDVLDNEYNLAKDLLQSDSIHLEQNLMSEKIKVNHFGLCETNGILNPITFKTRIETMKNKIHSDMITFDLDDNEKKCSYTKCQRCECHHCPIKVAGYIEYLRKTQQKIVRTNHDESTPHQSPFSFTLETDVIQHLNTATDGVISMAKFLQENNYVSLAYEKQSDIYLIHLANPNLTDNNLISDTLLSLQYEYKLYKSRNLKTTKIIHYAAIIDYLKKTNQFDKFMAKKKKNDDTIIASLEWYEKKIPQISHVLQLAESKNVHLLRCIIQGEPKVGKSELAKKIAFILAKNKKISTNTINKYNLQQLTEIFTKHTAEGYLYYPFQKNQLYVLTGIHEFLLDYKAYHDTTIPSYEYRKKGIGHVMDLLRSLSHDTYVILEGSQKDIEGLLALDEKIKFIFSENRLIFENLTIEEIYNIFINGLSEDICHDAKKQKDFYKRFADYITYNDKYLPFQNKELGNYLAKYCNDHHALILPPNDYNKKSTQDLLNEVVGMENIKKKLFEFENYAKYLKKASVHNLHIPSANLHMIFTGNPGTGKTMIARTVADILFTYGLIRENKLIEVERKDLVASHIGQTAIKTAEIIEKARGGVLFIDEAYSLDAKAERDFGHEAIATLIKAMEDFKDELVVIFAGYKNEMEDFIQMNPGIASRIGYTFDFKDYTPVELTEIYRRKMMKAGFIFEDDILDKVLDICTYYSKKRNFGNGRFVDKLVQETIINCANHSKHDQINKLDITFVPELKDLLSSTIYSQSSLDEMLKDIIGMNSIKKEMKQFEKYIEFCKKAKEQNIILPSPSLHMLFTGNPGTGKTTIARIIAHILYNLGFLYENKLVEVERKDLVAGYVGQTAIKTHEVIEKALGGVLFIDEAYSLNNGYHDFGHEAVATLIKAMEDHKDNLVVIFAGYEEEMKHFVDMNPGIASRIGYTFHFSDYSADELTDIYELKMQNANLQTTPETLESVRKVMQYFCNVPRFGNGRFVDRIVQKSIIKHAMNCDEEQLFTISALDIPTIREVIDSVISHESMIDPDKITNDILKRIAFHEIGHAIIQKVYFPKQKIHKITINPEGTGALGYVEHESMSYIQPTRDDLFRDIVVCMAGLACEEEYLGDYASGGSNDLRRATNKAKYMIMKLGMSQNGFAVVEEETKDIMNEVNTILKKAFQTAKTELHNWNQCIQDLNEYLLEHKTIDEDIFISFMEQSKK